MKSPSPVYYCCSPVHLGKISEGRAEICLFKKCPRLGWERER